MNKASERQARYDARHTKRYGLKLNTETDADIIAKLDQADSIQGYIKQLIRDDITRCGHENGHDAAETA